MGKNSLVGCRKSDILGKNVHWADDIPDLCIVDFSIGEETRKRELKDFHFFLRSCISAS